MRNIGLLIYDLRSGGAERVICKWSDLLSSSHNIKLYIFDDSSKIAYNYSGDLKVLRSASKGNSLVKRVITVLKRSYLLHRQLKKDNIDLLVSFCSTANIPAAFQCVSKIISIRVYSEYSHYRVFYRFVIKHTKTNLLVQTQRLKTEIVKDIGIRYEDKILVISNPMDVDWIQEKMSEVPDHAFLEKIRNKKVICFTASFKKTKNHWNLIKSFKLLHDSMPNTILLLIGGEGEYEDQAHKMAIENGLDNDIIFTGKTDNPFMYEKHSDIFVLPSLSEGIPNVLLEAMAIGLPVISTDCPSGPREILYETPNFEFTSTGIEQADYGILVPSFDWKPDFNISSISEENKVLSEAIMLMLSDNKIMKHYQQAASIKSKQFSIDEYRKDLEKLLSSVT